MNSAYQLKEYALLLSFYLFLSTTACNTLTNQKPYLLSTHNVTRTKQMSWDIVCMGGIKVVDPHTPGRTFTFRAKKLHIVSSKQGVTLNGKQFFGNHILLTSVQSSGFLVAGKKVVGDLVLVKKKNERCLVAKPSSLTTVPQKNSIPKQVRVLLSQAKSTTSPCWHISAPDGIVIYDVTKHKKIIYRRMSDLTIEHSKGKLFFNGVLVKEKQCVIMPIKGYLSFAHTQYQGSFIISHDKNKSLLVNQLDIEDYVFSVLKTESWPGWPLEVNKAFAIASRTYVYAMMQQAQSGTLPYHVKNTNLHQTYTGHHTTQVLKLAVEQTRSVVLTHEKRPILAMFDSCCGGIIPADAQGVDFARAPYLARPYACTFCQQYKIYHWQAEYAWDELQKKVQRYIPAGQLLRHIAIAIKDAAGLVRTIQLKTDRTTVIISGQEWYCLFKEVKSFCFDLTIKNKMLYLSGRGFGHHVGLCQWGARQMVNEGWDYKQILMFYYPNVSFMKI